MPTNRTIRPRQMRVIISFRISNIPTIETFNGTLRYLRSVANWNVQLITPPRMLTPEAVHRATGNGIDGILTDHPLDDNLTEALLASDIPLVSIGTSDSRLYQRTWNIAFLEMDNPEIGRLGARHFLSLGRFRTFAFLPDSRPTRWSEQRQYGFTEELRKNGHATEVFTSTAEEDQTDYRQDLKRWIATLQLPAALMLVGDYRASDIYDVCSEIGLSIPADLAILGVDNNPVLCEATTPSLSSIAPPFEEEGFQAARTLDKLMRARRPSAKPRTIRDFGTPFRIVERESTMPLAPGSLLVDRALAFIQANKTLPISAKDVAARLGVSPTLLALRFRQFEKKTVRESIIDARLKEVRLRLDTSRASIAQIARQCGFASANRLTHLFTQRHGESPRAYRAHEKT